MTVFQRSRPASQAAMATPRSSTSSTSSQLRILSANLTLELPSSLTRASRAGALP